MNQPDFRALCAQLANSLDSETGYIKPDGTRWSHPTVVRARAELATPPPEPPTEKELMELEEKLWDKYKVIGYQGEELMHDDGFEYALCDYRSILQIRWGK